MTATESGAAGTPPATRTRMPALSRLLGLLSLHQRFMVVPLLALVLISGLTAGFVYQSSRQARLLDRIASTDFAENRVVKVDKPKA